MDYCGWTIKTPDCALFSSLLSGAGSVIGEVLDDVIPILIQCLQPHGDPEMRQLSVVCVFFVYVGFHCTM